MRVFVLRTEQGWEVHRAGTSTGTPYATLTEASNAAKRCAEDFGGSVVCPDSAAIHDFKNALSLTDIVQSGDVVIRHHDDGWYLDIDRQSGPTYASFESALRIATALTRWSCGTIFVSIGDLTWPYRGPDDAPACAEQELFVP